MKQVYLYLISFTAGAGIVLTTGATVHSAEPESARHAEKLFVAEQQKGNREEVVRDKNLEPYLRDTLPDLVAQIISDTSPYIIKRRAMARLVSRYPIEAPDELVRFLYHPGEHLNEYTGRLLFQLGRPNSKTDELVARIKEGRTKWTLEQIVAFAQAASWPGNRAAVPVLQRMIDGEWDTANEARLCIARIQDEEGPHELLKLPGYARGDGGNYRSSVDYSRRVGQLLRTMADSRANDVLLEDDNPGKALALWDQRGVYALAWPGNKALANAYLKTPEPYAYFHIAAARTHDERCLKVIRRRFESEAAKLLADKAENRNLGGFRWILIAGVEAANAETVPTLKKLLKMTEDMRAAAEADLKARIENNDPILRVKQPNTDPAGFVREIILKGLCIHPNPGVQAVVKPYLTDQRLGYFVGLAMLRAGHAEGLQYILGHWSRYPGGSSAAEVFLIYTAADVLPHSRYHPDVTKAEAWYTTHKETESLRDRIALVNQKGLSEPIVETLKLWP